MAVQTRHEMLTKSHQLAQQAGVPCHCGLTPLCEVQPSTWNPENEHNQWMFEYLCMMFGWEYPFINQPVDG